MRKAWHKKHSVVSWGAPRLPGFGRRGLLKRNNPTSAKCGQMWGTVYFKSLDAEYFFYAVAACCSGSPNFTETSLEIPASCMVTPYITAAAPIVFLL